jgi:hypothetical protein
LSIEDDDEIRYFGEDSASRAEDILFLATAENGMFRSLTETPTKCEEAYWMQLLKSGFKWFGGGPNPRGLRQCSYYPPPLINVKSHQKGNWVDHFPGCLPSENLQF